MKTTTRLFGCVGATFLAALLVSGASAGETVRDLGDGRALVVDFSGKPPFSRKIVAIKSLNASQARRLAGEATSASLGRAQSGPRGAGFGAKPPFRKRVSSQRAQSDVSFARFEEQPARDKSKVRRGPPGKSLPARRR